MSPLKITYQRIPFEYRLSIAYLIIGALWILFSDKIAGNLSDNEEMLSLIQLYKGWFYVLSTAVALFFFSRLHARRLRKAENIAKQNEKLKTAFIENISHELRTPMNAIIGFTEIAQTEGATDEEKHQYLEIILNSSKQLLSIVNDVMDTSLLESGNSYVHKEIFTLDQMLDSVHAYFSPLMRDSVHLKINRIGSNLTINTDKEKLTRVFHNLVNNAIKFTHKGQIEVGYQIKERDILFFVKDTGVGIREELHHSIFERFKQAEIELSNRTGGTGLGLSICKEILLLLEGKIWLESQPGEGTQFYFSMSIDKISA
ncbi:HAMP domain-containing sensor histidine kinase [Carboxylicivirga sp. M1479]|uniref:sensor histidine kinase n=1 Tax=Carboxylicivirga sp. M1479 TaxID=2594476 RepID=UPI00117879A2|nr:HAMP domain-containing sensor histidine kinase [Carboxylicivirga sp. M1479]TRX64005.1 HAMP domain-containing histidine kinase [Carboxylicivirga sp. M1479]